MKKKGLLALLLLAAMICSIALSGCTLVKLNEERQANRIMATVSDEVRLENQAAIDMLKSIGITDYKVTIDINRRELITSTNYTINRMSSLYQSYYGTTYSYDYETVMGDTLDSLIANKYYVIKAIEYLLNNSDTERLKSMYMFCKPEEYKAFYGNKLSAEGVLTMAERYGAIGTVNDSLQSLLDGYISDEEEDVRNDRISAADNKISEYYEQGYFVSKVILGKEETIAEGEEIKTPYKNASEEGVTVYTDNKEKFVSGIYKDNFVLTGTVKEDDDATDAPDSSEIDYKKVFAIVELTLKKEGGNEVVYVPRPISSMALSITRDTGADFEGQYIRTRTATVSYTGRVYAKVTEDNDTGYTSEEFTSAGVSYKVAFPRNALKEEAEEVDYLQKNEVRYASKEKWETFFTIFNTETKVLNKEDAKYTGATEDDKAIFDGMAELYDNLFVTSYNGTDKNVKDGYRQLRETLSSANIGYVESEPEDKSSDEYKYYKNYNGLYIYYNDQFMSVILDAVKYEKGLAINITPAEIEEAYIAKVRQDKVKYDSIGYSEQLDKFFSDTSDIAEVFYVPMAALETQYEIDPKDKSYAPLFKADGTLKAGIENKYVYVSGEGEEKKYTMPYIVKNDDDNTYTINAFFVGALLFNFENNKDISDKIDIKKNDDNTRTITAIYGYKDWSEEKKVQLLKELAYQLKTYGQIVDGDVLQEDITDIDQLYAAEDDSVIDIIADILTEATDKTRDEVLEIFKKYMEKYNDDSGKLKDPGYLITSGEVSDSWAMTDFPSGARAIYYTLLAAGYDFKDGDAVAASDLMFGEGMTYYGLHYMMVTLAPYYHVTLIKVDDGYALAPNTVINLAGDTQTNLIAESLKTAKTTSEYSDWQASFSDDDIEKATSKNEKNYKKLVKDITENK